MPSGIDGWELSAIVAMLWWHDACASALRREDGLMTDDGRDEESMEE